ncbi:hypothetical protein D3C81_1387140 [compost metagenome]
MAWSEGGCSTAVTVVARSLVDEHAESRTASATTLARLRIEGFMTPFPFGLAAFRIDGQTDG